MGPPKGPDLARSTSTWIHWWSPVASANRFTCSWVTSCQSLYPRCCPVLSRNPSMPLTIVVMGRPYRRQADLSALSALSVEPDSLVLPALGMEQQGHQGDLEHEGHQGGQVGGAPEQAAGEQVQSQGDEGHHHPESVAPLALVGDAVAGPHLSGDEGQAQGHDEAAAQQLEEGVDVEQEHGDLQGLGLRVVDPPAALHGPSLAAPRSAMEPGPEGHPQPGSPAPDRPPRSARC